MPRSHNIWYRLFQFNLFNYFLLFCLRFLFSMFLAFFERFSIWMDLNFFIVTFKCIPQIFTAYWSMTSAPSGKHWVTSTVLLLDEVTWPNAAGLIGWQGGWVTSQCYSALYTSIVALTISVLIVLNFNQWINDCKFLKLLPVCFNHRAHLMYCYFALPFNLA